MKRIILLTLLLVSFAADGQDTLYDYLTIKESGGVIAVFSTTSAPRTVDRIKPVKSEDDIVVRYEEAYYQIVFALVQEYEAQGWYLFEVDERIWIMRKPKQ